MNMVFYSIYDHGIAIFFSDQTANYAMQIISPIFFNQTHPVFNSKNSVNKDLMVIICHFNKVKQMG